jgi:molybdate transport system substrate-binding protein
VGGILGKLTQGAVDAGFVYVTDVTAAKGALSAISLPARLQPAVRYGVAVVQGTKHREQAQAFVDGLLTGSGAQQLLKAGFRAP